MSRKLCYDYKRKVTKMYDIVFISYQELNADENYAALKERFPMVKRVHGVKGIHQAHITAAKKCFTKMFWAVDADAIVLDNFNFDYLVDDYNLETVHVWHSQNPINDLVYGYGGVKLLPRKLTIDMDITKLDMTTSISNHFKIINKISNITAFNTDEFSTWRSAFRECAKLASKQLIDKTQMKLIHDCQYGVIMSIKSNSLANMRFKAPYLAAIMDQPIKQQ
jgi:hypothetical protein